MTRINFNNNTIVLSGEKPDKNKLAIAYKDVVDRGVNWLLRKIAKENKPKEIFVWGETPNNMLSLFKHQLNLIIAGGGLIRKPTGEVLFIYRKGKWDFPKGKPDEGEDIETTALREIEEECGIKHAKIISPLPDTFHIYSFTDKIFALKQCKWFYMEIQESEPLVLQNEEGITDARWVNLPFPNEIIDEAYLSIKDLALWYQQNYLRLPGL